MRERGIIFSAPMVRALLDGRKTQTRRVLKPQPIADVASFQRVFKEPPFFEAIDVAGMPIVRAFAYPKGFVSPYPRIPYAPGDRLWVREDWRTVSSLDRDTPSQMRDMALDAGYRRAWAPIEYLADGARDNWETGDDAGRRRWSRHMPRWASRLTLTITDVRVQRVQEISAEDVKAEGVEWGVRGGAGDYRHQFINLWNSLHGPDAWGANPWVCAISFTVHRLDIDQMEGAA